MAEVQQTVSHGTSVTGPLERSDACPNCGAKRLGAYCYDCGQHFIGGRLTLRRMWREFAERFLKLERGLWLTFRELMKSPGRVARHYVEGQRRRYINPLSYFLLAATFSLLIFALTGDLVRGAMYEQVQGQFEANPRSEEVFAEIFGENPAQGYTNLVFNATRGTYTYLLLLLGLALALLLRLFRSETGYNLAEGLVLALYVVGHATLFASFIMPLMAYLGPYGSMGISILLYGMVAGLAGLGFYGRQAKNFFLPMLAVGGAYLIYMVFVILFIIALILFTAFQRGLS